MKGHDMASDGLLKKPSERRLKGAKQVIKEAKKFQAAKGNPPQPKTR